MPIHYPQGYPQLMEQPHSSCTSAGALLSLEMRELQHIADPYRKYQLHSSSFP